MGTVDHTTFSTDPSFESGVSKKHSLTAAAKSSAFLMSDFAVRGCLFCPSPFPACYFVCHERGTEILLTVI